MKMTRREMKLLVKECLVEILSEGLTQTHQTISESRQASTAQLRGTSVSQGINPQASPRQTIAEKISFLPARSEIRNSHTHSHQSSPAALVGGLTSDPVMADIFADTARKGAYKNMNESSAARVDHEQMVESAGDHAAKAMLRSDPVDVFGESASKWASLAFAEKIPTRS